MAYRYISVLREGHLIIVTIARPEAYNALTNDAHAELGEVFDDFARDDEQWVAILRGAGERAFCAGHDLKHQAAGGRLETPASGFAGLTARHDLVKPVIAAVNGVAMGGGCEIVLACDIAVASPNAVFALPEPRVGLAAIAGGIQRLSREIGLKRAMGMMLTGRHVSAQEALELVFINEVASDGALTAARRWANEILMCSPMSVRATKQAVLRSLSSDIPQAMREEWDYPAMQAMLASADAVEGSVAFAKKRPPRWSGR
ncbi:enoyl-CoA hydratase-related protein [Aquisediminimonas sediminicola]|uniref:enoyl-CoA hydratase-related protein n=1 Tax=Alteraquisediminimonas sediminicola TaxID=2676787 RepID=UPI001C8DD838|nr:enoyl-CoA hydratase-related protein [Aquisediminimonas sediminicola]